MSGITLSSPYSSDLHHSGHSVLAAWLYTASVNVCMRKKCFDHHWVAGFFSFFTGNVIFACLSNSVLVGCIKFQRSVGCKTSSFLLTTAPSSSFDFLFSFALLRCSLLLTRGRVLQKIQTAFLQRNGSGRAGCGREKILALLLCSACALPEAYQIATTARNLFQQATARWNTNYVKQLSKVTAQ